MSYDKYEKSGWKKFEYPPDMITIEEKTKNMKLSWNQTKRAMERQIENRILMNTRKGDNVTAAQWKALRTKIESKQLATRINEEFTQDFIKFLTGRSTWNATEYFELVKDEYGQTVGKSMSPGCPWGNKPLVNLPGVSEFLDQGLDRRSKVIAYIAKLKANGPRNLNEAYMYYKYILRREAVDEDVCFELEELSDFDYPVDPDTGATVGPASIDTPPLFNQERYRRNFMYLYAFSVTDSPRAAVWIASGAVPVDLSRVRITGKFRELGIDDYVGFFESDEYELIYDPTDETYYTVRDYMNYWMTNGNQVEIEQAQRNVDDWKDTLESRRRANRRDRRKAARMPNPKAAKTTGGGTAGIDIFGGPEVRRTDRRINRREDRRDARNEDQREDLSQTLTNESFGTAEYVSFWALSGPDQDYIISVILSNNAAAFAAEAEESAVLTSGSEGAPVIPNIDLRGQAPYPFPGEKTDEISKEIKGNQKKIVSELQKIKTEIEKVPGAVNDKAVLGVLEEISKKIDGLELNPNFQVDVPGGGIGPITINNPGMAEFMEQQTTLLSTMKDMINSLGVKIENFNPKIDGEGGAAAAGIPAAINDMAQRLDANLKPLAAALNGMPQLFAALIPKQEIIYQQVPGGTGSTTHNNSIQNAAFDAAGAAFTINNAQISNSYGLDSIAIPMAEAIANRIAIPNVTVNPQVNVQPQVQTGDIQAVIQNPNISANLNIDMKELGKFISDQIDAKETEREAARTARESKYQQDLLNVYNDLKGSGVKQTEILDTMYKTLSELNTTQVQVANALSENQKALTAINGFISVEKQSTRDKLDQFVKLDQESVNALLGGTAGSVQPLLDTMATALYEKIKGDANTNGNQILEAMKKFTEHAEFINGHLETLQKNYIPPDMKDYVPKNILEQISNTFQSSQNTLAQNIQVARVTQENFDLMKQELLRTETEYKLKEAEFKNQFEQQRSQIEAYEAKTRRIFAELELKSTQEKEKIMGEMISQRNQLMLVEGELSKKASEYAVLSESHHALSKAIETFKNAPPAQLNINYTELGAEVSKALSPVLGGIQKNISEVKQAVENADFGGDGSNEPDLEDVQEQKQEPEPPPQTMTNFDVEAMRNTRYISESLIQHNQGLGKFLDNALRQNPNSTVLELIQNPVIAASQKYAAIRNQIFDLKTGQLRPDADYNKLQHVGSILGTQAARSMVHNSFMSLPAEEQSALRTPMSKIEGNKLDALLAGITVLTQKGPGERTHHAAARFESLVDLLANTQERIDNMGTENVQGQNKSVLAELTIGKLNMLEMRHLTGYSGADGKEYRPKSATDLTSYVALVNTAREITKLATNGETQLAEGLMQHARSWSGFNGNEFVRNSPLYQNIAFGQDFSGALASAGTAHIDENYFSPQFKAQASLKTDAFNSYMLNSIADRPGLAEEQKQELINKFRGTITPSKTTEKALSRGDDADIKNNTETLDLAQQSMYLEGFIKATLAHKASQFIAKKQEHGTRESKELADLDQLQKTISKEAEIAVTDSNPDYAGKETLKTWLKARQETVDKIASEIASMLSAENTVSSGYTEITSNPGIHSKNLQAAKYSEALDTLTGLGDSDVLNTLNLASQKNDDDLITFSKRSQLIASNIKKSMNSLYSESATAKNEDLSKTSTDKVTSAMLNEALGFINSGSNSYSTLIGGTILHASRLVPPMA